MPTPTKGPRLGGSPAHERLMLANLATALFEHGRITTTQAKAKRVRPLAERLITFAKRGDLAARRRVLTVVRDKGVVHTLFTEIGPRFANRPGGYTRITKTMPRKGDNAPMAVIELVEGLTVAQEAVGEAERARGTRFARRATPGPATLGGATAASAAAAPSAEDAEAPGTGTELPATDAGVVDPATPAEAGDEGAPLGTASETPAGPTPAADEPGGAPADDGVADEAGEQPAEDVTSPQTAGAGDTEQAEGDPSQP